MTSLTVARFWTRYRALPADVRRAARSAYVRFESDPFHPGLRFKELHGYPDVWSCRINDSYRAVGVRSGDTITWFWVGSHGEFDQRFG